MTWSVQFNWQYSDKRSCKEGIPMRCKWYYGVKVAKQSWTPIDGVFSWMGQASPILTCRGWTLPGPSILPISEARSASLSIHLLPTCQDLSTVPAGRSSILSSHKCFDSIRGSPGRASRNLDIYMWLFTRLLYRYYKLFRVNKLKASESIGWVEL